MKAVKFLLAFLFVMVATSAEGQTRFITDKNYYFVRGLAASADSAIVTMPDTVFTTETGSKIIIGSLYDQATCWDRDAFHAISRNTSWYGRTDTLATFPDEYAIWITTGQDSVVIWDRQTSKEWLILPAAAASWLGATPTVTDVEFVDGVLWITDSSGYCSLLGVDFLRDENHYYTTSGVGSFIPATIDGRTGATATLIFKAAPAIVNNAVNAVAVIRDPEGSTDEFGRPKQIVGVNTAGGPSVSDAGITVFYDDAESNSPEHIAISPSGFIFYNSNNATADFERFGARRVQTYTADDNFHSASYYYVGTGGQAKPWASGTGTSALEIVSEKSLQTLPLVVIASSEGLLISHAAYAINGGPQYLSYQSLTFSLDDDEVNPPWSGTGTKMRSWNFQSNGTDAFGNAPVANENAVTFTTAGVQGNAANFVAASEQSLIYTDGVDWAFTTALSVGCWFRREVDSGSVEGLISKHDDGIPADQTFVLYISSDKPNFNTAITGPAAVQSVGPTISLDTWYFVVGTFDGTTQRLYLDGELVDSDAQVGTLIDGTEPPVIGAMTDETARKQWFDGQIDQAFVMDRVLSADEIRSIYKQGVEQQQSTVSGNDALASDDIDYIAVSGDLIAAGDEDSVTVLNTRGVPIAVHGSPGGNIQDVSIRQVPGSTDYELAIATTTRVQWIQSNPKIVAGGESAPKNLFGPTIWNPRMIGVSAATPTGYAVVDSSGNGHFTNVQDAINAGYGHIYIVDGTYPSFDAATPYLHVEGQSWNVIIDGGVTDHAIYVQNKGIIIENLSVRTTANGGQSYSGVVITAVADSSVIDRVFVRESDDSGIIWAPASYCQAITISNCRIFNTDGGGIGSGAGSIIINNEVNGTGSTATAVQSFDNDYPSLGGTIISGNRIQNGGGAGIGVHDRYTVVTGNFVHNMGGDGIWLQASSGDSSIVDGNRFSEWTGESIDDDSTGSTIGDNNVLD
jgi:hypothetical protein